MKHPGNILALAVTAFMLSVFCSMPAYADETPPANHNIPGTAYAYDDWHVLFYLPAWAPGMNGDLNLRGRPVSVAVNYEDQIENLRYLKSIGLGHLEVKKGPIGVLVEVIYGRYAQRASFAKDIKLPVIPPASIPVAAQIHATVASSFDEGALLYDVYRSKSEIFGRPILAVEALGGGRFVYFMAKADTTVSTGFGSRQLNVKGKREWTDPFLGGRANWNMSDNWMASLRGDVGGFGLTSAITCNLDAMIRYRVSRRLNIEGGYRALYMDHKEDSGRKEFHYRVWSYAPWLGVGVEF